MSDVKYDQWETDSTSKVLHKHLHNTVIIKQHQMVQRPNCNFRVFIKNHLVDKYQDCVWRKAAAAHLVFLWETRVLPVFFAIVSDVLSATINCRSLGIVSSTCVTLFEVRARHAFCELKTPRSDRYSRSYWIEEITWNIKFDLHVYPIFFFNNKNLKKNQVCFVIHLFFETISISAH